jgi:hypothetical protein
MADLDEHLFSLPFGLPDDRDRRLVRYLRDEDWASALVLLREVVTAETDNPKWLLLLAFVRFHDATDVMVEELADATREALQLIDRALEQGASFEAVTPLRDAVERVLDEVSREELEVMDALERTPLPELKPELLELAAFLVWKKEPLRAAGLFDELARRGGAHELVSRTRAALCLADANATDAQEKLAAAIHADWRTHARDRSVLETAETALLERLTGMDFEVAWKLAEAKGAALDLPFPSVWPNQERLLTRCLAIGEVVRARALAHTLEEREELSTALKAKVHQALAARA